MLVVRGLALGACIQPLTVAGLSEIGPRQLAQASSLNTVTRAVSSSLGIAVLATLVQTQAKVHYSHLAEQVTASSALGQLLPRLQALFVAQGASLDAARGTALQIIAGLVQEQGFILALQDAFTFTALVTVLAIIAVLFVRGSRKPAHIPAQNSQVGGDAELEATPMILVE